jgi:cytochrome c peroxidase
MRAGGRRRAASALRLRGLEHFPAKWMPVRVAKMRSNKGLEPRSDSIGTEKALVAIAAVLAAGLACAIALPASEARPAAPLSVTEEPITPVPGFVAGNPRKTALGARLFTDRRLSADGARSCASCHDVTGNGAQGVPASSGADGETVDTLTVFNAALNFRLGWDGAFRSLEEHLLVTLESEHTLGGSIPAIVVTLGADPATRRLFMLAYGAPPTAESLIDALASYERTLLTPGSRFDRWLQGDKAALDAEEERGYRMFKALGCVSCHQGVNVGGNLFQRRSTFRALPSPKPDMLRVPGLRNVAVTAPYFRDGSAATLEDAVRKMGEAQLNTTLSEFEVTSLVAFLRTLTGEYRGRKIGAAP